MAYDEGLAQRIRDVLDDERGITEKKMFGGLAFLVNGKMACGVIKDEPNIVFLQRAGTRADVATWERDAASGWQ